MNNIKRTIRVFEEDPIKNTIISTRVAVCISDHTDVQMHKPTTKIIFRVTLKMTKHRSKDQTHKIVNATYATADKTLRDKGGWPIDAVNIAQAIENIDSRVSQFLLEGSND